MFYFNTGREIRKHSYNLSLDPVVVFASERIVVAEKVEEGILIVEEWAVTLLETEKKDTSLKIDIEKKILIGNINSEYCAIVLSSL